jgi:hypothetical protein
MNKSFSSRKPGRIEEGFSFSERPSASQDCRGGSLQQTASRLSRVGVLWFLWKMWSQNFCAVTWLLLLQDML